MSSEDQSVVAMLDLLGFSRIMEEQSLDEIERRYTQHLMGAVTMAAFSSIGAFVFDDDGNLDSSEDLWTVSFGAFSDTVIIYPGRLVDQPLRTTCEVVAILMDVALQTNWLFRGGIDYGSFRALPDHNLYIGKAMIGAYKLEHLQDWAGAIVGDRAREKYTREVEEMLDQRLLVECPVPIKTASGIVEQNRISINWCYFDMAWQKNRREKLLELQDSAPDAARKKVQATLKFHDRMVSCDSANLSQICEGRVFGDPTGGAT